MNTSRNSYVKAFQVFSVCVVMLMSWLFIQQPAFAASEGANVLFILDGSGSMWGRLEGDTEKIVIAKKRMTEWVQDWENANMGLIVYGHRRKGDCDDIEMMVPLGAGNQEAVIQQVQSVSPKGKTPIKRSIQLAAEHLKTLEEETAIVLVSDGLETCDPDPCGYVKSLKERGIKFTLDVVGFDINDEERGQLECLANAGGGRYYSAQNAMQLKEAFTEVKKEVVKKVETKPAGPQPGDVWTEPVTGMEFVWIPGGCFQMGQTEQETEDLQPLLQIVGEKGKEALKSELPRHRVCLDGFWMGKYEVTNAQYRRWKATHDSTDYEGYSLNGDNQPVVYVSWEDANAFTDWLTDQQNGPYTLQLPTEAQWEYAARAGTTISRFWGDDFHKACQYANIADRATEQVLRRELPQEMQPQCHDGYVVTAPVGSFQPNMFGLYDVLGNVWEWSQDWWNKDYYSKSPSENPQGPSSGSQKIRRGYGWKSPSSSLGWRFAYRNPDPANDSRDNIGFRLMRMP